jgi:hypothetical protein
VGILLMLTVLGMLAVLMANLGSQSQRLARAQTESEVALNAAEAGLAIALETYIRDSEYQGDTEPQPFGTIGSTYQITLYDESNPPADGTMIPADHTLIMAQGWSESGALRSVSAMVTEQIETEGHDNALLAGERLFVSGNAQIASIVNGVRSQPGQRVGEQLQEQSVQTSETITVTLFGKTATLSTGGGGFFGMSLLSIADAEEGAPEGVQAARKSSKTSSLKSASMEAAPMDMQMDMAMAAEEEVVFEEIQLDSQAAGTQSSDGDATAHIAVAGDGQDALTLESGAVVDGELRIPPGADESSVVNDTGSFHDGVHPQSPPTMVPVRLPLVPGDQDINWSSSSSPSAYGDSFSGNELKPGAYGDVVVDGGVLELNTADLGSGDKDLYIFRSLTLQNGGKVVLKGAAENNDVISGLYIDEKFEVVDGSLINETSDPSRLQVYVSDGAPVNLDFEEEAAAMLYAPGSVVNMNEGDLVGNIVGKEVNLNDGAVVQYDSDLASLKPDPWGNGGFYAYKKSYRRR